MSRRDAAAQLERARLFARSGDRARAEAILRVLADREPQNAQASFDLAIMLLARGEYAEGWKYYESRFAAAPRAPQPYPWPVWHGQSLEGRTLVARCEQGFGDIIQFARFLPLLKRHCNAAKLTAVVPPALRTLFQAFAEVDEILSEGDQLRRHDYWVWMGSLPLRFNATIPSLSRAQPYLRADAGLAAQWRSSLPAQGPRIGLAWAGARHTPGDQVRSLSSINDLAPVFAIPGASFVSLQRDREQEISASGFDVVSVGDKLRDFADAAAVIDGLDVLISVDTAYAHLAAAMGKPTVLLLGIASDWRWMIGRSDSPWYPSVTILRKQTPTSWDDPVSAAALLARQLIERHSPPVEDATPQPSQLG